MEKLSDYALGALAAAGAKHVFMVPGGAAMHLNDSLARSRELTYSCFFHEHAAAVAAEAYAKRVNRLGVAMVTAGPGSTNAVTGVATAWVNSAPLVVLSGQVKSADLNPGSLRQCGLQEIDIVSIVRPITKYAVTITDATTAVAELDRAIGQAVSGRPGPVWLSMPLDIQAAMINPVENPESSLQRTATAGSACPAIPWEELISRINRAERPIFLVGYGVRAAGAEAILPRLIDLLGMPVQTTWIGCDLVDQGHPLFAGRPGSFASRAANFAIQNSDCVLAIGCRLDLATTGYSRDRFARDAYKIVVDVDPTEVAKLGKTVDLGLPVDARQFIEQLLDRGDQIQRHDRTDWLARIRDWEQRYPLVSPAVVSDRRCVSSYKFVNSLGSALSNTDTIVEGSSGIHAEIFFMTFGVKWGQRVVTDGSFGSMGYGLPAAIGACIAAGRTRTVLVEGDGSLQPQLQELETIRREALPVKIFVVNNDGFASIRVSQNRFFQRLIAADASSGLTLPSLERIADAYGIDYHVIDHESQLGATIECVLQSDGPSICEVIVPKEEDRAPRLASVQRPDGSMHSRPMEDMFPFLDREEFRGNMIVTPIEEKDAE